MDKTLYYVYFAFIAGSAIHVAIGISYSTLFTYFLIASSFLLAIKTNNINNVFIILIFGIILRYIGGPFIIKIFYWQPIDEYLSNSEQTFYVIFVGISCYLFAMLAVSRINLGKILLKTSEFDLKKVQTFSIVSYLVALTFIYSSLYSKDNDTSYGIQLYQLIYFSITASVVVYIRKKRLVYLTLPIIFSISAILFGFLHGSRAMIVEVLIVVFLSFYLYSRQTSILKLLLGGLLILFILTFITPVVLSNRNQNAELDPLSRINEITNNFISYDSSVELYEKYERDCTNDELFILNYYGTCTNIADRFSFVKIVDLTTNTVFKSIPSAGYSYLELAFQKQLPKFINKNKDRSYSEGDMFFCNLGYKCSYGNFLVAPLIPFAYYLDGYVGVIFIVFFLSFFIFFMIKKIFGLNINNNFLLLPMCIIIFNQFTEGGVESYLYIILRQIPHFTLLLIFCFKLTSVLKINNSIFK